MKGDAKMDLAIARALGYNIVSQYVAQAPGEEPGTFGESRLIPKFTESRDLMAEAVGRLFDDQMLDYIQYLDDGVLHCKHAGVHTRMIAVHMAFPIHCGQALLMAHQAWPIEGFEPKTINNGEHHNHGG